jgi:hypothetical protein
MECEKELREQSIKEYAKSADHRDVIADIETMIRKYDPNQYMRISSGVDIKIIVDAFRPFLATYYLSLYSFDRTQQSYCQMKLGRDLSQFIYANLMFGQKTGRKLPSDDNPFIPSRKTEYHLKWIRPRPVRLSTEHFMKSHLFDDGVFDRYVVQGDVNMAYMLPINTIRSSDLFVRRTAVPSESEEDAEMQMDSESEEDTEMQMDSESEEENAIVIVEEDHLSEVSVYQSEEEREEEDYDW